MSGPSLSIVVFAYNEAENVGPVLRELRQWLAANEPQAEIVFVDDGSTDRTLDAAEEALSGFASQFARHEYNRGIGAALKTGVRQARAPWVTFMPADGQIEPESIGVLCAAARSRNLDSSAGGGASADANGGADSRLDGSAGGGANGYASGGVEGEANGCADSPPDGGADGGADSDVDVVFSVYDNRDDGPYRKLLSFGVRVLISWVHGVRMQSDGPYLFRRELFVPEKLPPDSFFLNFEFPIRALSKGLRCRTVTIRCRPRRAGVSKSAGVKRVGRVARDLVDLRVRRFREDRRLGTS